MRRLSRAPRRSSTCPIKGCKDSVPAAVLPDRTRRTGNWSPRCRHSGSAAQQSRSSRFSREHRPEPREEYARSLLERLQAAPRPSRPALLPAGGRLAAAAALTALALVAATAAAGGVGAASHDVAGFTNVKQTFGFNSNTATTAGKNNDKGDKGDKGDKPGSGGDESNEGPGDHQYSVEICHATGSAKNPYVELRLSPQGAAQHLLHHPDDFIEPPQGCPGEKEHGHEHD